MKKTLQDQYLLIKEGKGHKGVFIKEAKQQFPGLIRNSATYTEVANVLKTKNLINENVIGLEPINQLEPSKKESYEVAFENFLAEAKKKKEEDEKAELKKPSKQVEEDAEKNFDYEDKKNPDNLIFDQMMKGYYTEMKDPKNEDKTMEQLKAIVIKNLEKNPIYYTEKGQFGVKDLGYTSDVPGLGEPKEPKGKFKSSGYGDLKENKLLKEALNKDLKDFGSDVKKFLESKGLKVKLGQGEARRALYDPIEKNDELAALQLHNPDLHIIVNDSKVDVLEDIIKRYNLKTLQSLRQTGGWDDDPKKKAQAKGEIYLTKELKQGRKGKAFELVISRFDPSSIFVPSNNKESINEETQIRKVVRSIINEELEDEFYQKQQDLDNMTFDQEKEAHRQAQEYSTEGITQHVNYDGIGYFVSDEFSEDTIATYENGKMINADALREAVDSEKDERYFIKNKKRKSTSHLPGFHKPSLGEEELEEGYDDGEMGTYQRTSTRHGKDPQDMGTYLNAIKGMKKVEAIEHLGEEGLSSSMVMRVLNKADRMGMFDVQDMFDVNPRVRGDVFEDKEDDGFDEVWEKFKKDLRKRMGQPESPKNESLNESKIRKVIRESVEKELAEINKLAEYEVYESKLEKIAELIEKKCSRLNRLDEDEDLKALTDKKKVKELQRDIKKLEKAKAKLEKALAKKAKAAPKKKEVIDEDEPLEEIASEDSATTADNMERVTKATQDAANAAKELDDVLEENDEKIISGCCSAPISGELDGEYGRCSDCGEMADVIKL